MDTGCCPECDDRLELGYRADLDADSLVEVLCSARIGDEITVYRACPTCEWFDVRRYDLVVRHG